LECGSEKETDDPEHDPEEEESGDYEQQDEQEFHVVIGNSMTLSGSLFLLGRLARRFCGFGRIGGWGVENYWKGHTPVMGLGVGN
jgi:hypothetical protein